MARLFDSDVSGNTKQVRDVRARAIEKIAMKSPVFSALRKVKKPRSSTPEWVIKTYANASTTAVAEVDVDTSTDLENNNDNRTILKGRYHKRRRVPGVGDVNEEANERYGDEGGSIFKDNVKDKMKEIYVDGEAVVLDDNESVAGSGASTASETRGAPRWLSNLDSRMGDTATRPDSAYRTPTASVLSGKAAATDITEDMVEDVLQSIAETRKDEMDNALLCIVKPAMRRRFGSFTRLDPTLTTSAMPIRRFNGKMGEIDRRVSMFKSDFGDMKLMTSFRLPSNVHFLALDMDALELGFLRAPRFKQLEDRGAGPVGIIDMIFVLMCLNPAAHGGAFTTPDI